jgi:hypothetical protein
VNPQRRQSSYRSLASVFLLTGLLGPAAVPAQAQQTRAEEIAQQQAEKSTRLTPNVATAAEKTLDWFEDHFTNPNTFYLTFGSIYPSAGFGPGVAYRRALGNARLSFGGALSFRNYKLAHATLSFPELLNRKLEVETRFRWVDATQVPFYGIGNETITGDRVNYGLRNMNVEANLTLKPVPWYRLGGGIGWRHVEDRSGVGNRPSIETVYTPFTAPGLASDTRYAHANVFTAIDWRESPGYTRRGGLYSITLNEFRDGDERFGFQRIDIELSQFVPILKEQWVLGIRALAQTTTVDSGQIVPYYLLPSLGGARTHRGYGDFRFQDRHMLVLNGEYRWLPSRVLDMALFVDAGKVASTRSDLDLNDLKMAYGIGARFHGPTMTPLRLDLAHGDEGFRLHITGGLTF